MPKVSVIIPVYNAKDYLARCLDSVCNQTLKDIEIICVNDCSTDNSIDILNDYANQYPNMKVIDCKVNGGESVARNIGLDNATGEYIAFVDNDDTIDLNFYEKLYEKAKEINADFVKGNTLTINIDKTQSYSYLNNLIRSDGKWFFYYEWWSAIYKKSIVDKYKLKLPEGYPLGGDVLFLNEFLIYARTYEVLDDISYYWLRRENSGESQILSYSKVESALKIYDKIESNANELMINKSIDEISYKHLINTCIWVALDYMFRNNIIESRELCCSYLIKYYENSFFKDDAMKYIYETMPYIYNYIQYGEKAVLERISNIKTKEEINKKNMCARLRLKKGYVNV